MDVSLSQLLDLSGKTAIITGAGGGIGKGIALRLHEAGANVVIADLDEPTAQATAAELTTIRDDSAIALHVNVAKSADVKKMVTDTVDQFGGVDILVNNAGIFPMQSLADMSEADFTKVIDVNLRGVFLCSKYISQQMISQGKGGKIINITSIDALHPSTVGLAHYDASKHGVWGFTKNVALELAEHRICVNAIAPGGVATPGTAIMQQPDQDTDRAKSAQEAFLARIPMHRMGEPDDIGKVALFLASELSSYMTGSQIVVDGGALLR